MLTNKEFEEYLKSIGGLENGIFIDRPPILERGFFSVGNGWLELIRDLINELLKIGWNKQTCQVKEKFGGLRFYVNGVPPGGFDIISKYEKKSYETCEVCGAPGKERAMRWIRVLCDTHFEESQSNKI